MKKIVLATFVSIFSCISVFAEHEWSTCSDGIENDLWTLGGTWNNGSFTITSATPKDGELTTLDVSNINISGKKLMTFNCWSNKKILTVKKLIIPAWTLTFNIQDSGMPLLEEVCTIDGGHQLSISSWNSGIVSVAELAGDYQITDIGSCNNKAFYSTKVNNVSLDGTFSSMGESCFYLCYDLETIEITTTGSLTAIPKQLCGHWSDKSPSQSPSPCQLRSITLNGAPMLRSSAITSVGYGAVANCVNYTDIIDLPSCTSIDTYGLRGNNAIPFANFMSLTSVGRGTFRDWAALDRVVFGTKSPMTLVAGETFCAAFNAPSSPSIIWNSTTAPSGIVESMFWNITNYKLTNYVRKEARSGWDTAVAAIPKMKQNFLSMDTSFKVYLRCDDKVLMTTLMPGVSGENSTWTIPSKWFFPAGATFGTGSVKDSGGNVIAGASATPDESGLNLTITLPASAVEMGAETQDVDVYVDLVKIVKTDPAITVVINDASDNELLRDSFDTSYGSSVTKDYSEAIFQTNKYYYTQVISTTVNPADALTATFSLAAKLSLENVTKDATVTVKINRDLRPVQKDYWEVAADGYSMSDGPWTFRCDFNNGRAVVANASAFIGSDIETATVDFSKPVKQNGNVLTIKSFDWGAEINGSAIDLTKNNCGKSIVLNGSTATANSVITALKLPTYAVDMIAGWGGCTKLVIKTEDIISITTNLGRYAFCETQVAGALTFSDDDVVTIGAHAFDGCAKITSVTIRKLGSTIADYGFHYITDMKSADLSGVVSIGEYAFKSTKVTTLTLCPVLKEYSPYVFSYSNGKLKMSVAKPTGEMFAMPIVNSRIGVEAFRDYRGEGALIIPFRGSVTNVGSLAFKWLGPCTNIVFWGKAPAPDAFDVKAFEGLDALNYQRRITASKLSGEADWLAFATPCTEEEKALPSYPGDGVCFGTKTFSDVKFWMCWGKSPWYKEGLMLIFR